MMGGRLDRVVRVAARARVPGIELGRGGIVTSAVAFSLVAYIHFGSCDIIGQCTSASWRVRICTCQLKFLSSLCETRERCLRLYKPRWGKVRCRTPNEPWTYRKGGSAFAILRSVNDKPPKFDLVHSFSEITTRPTRLRYTSYFVYISLGPALARARDRESFEAYTIERQNGTFRTETRGGFIVSYASYIGCTNVAMRTPD
jgi:hypothetical protein